MTREQLEHLIRAAARHRMADPETLLRRLAAVEVDPAIREKAHVAVVRAFETA